MVLYLPTQLRCRNKNQTKLFIKRRTHQKLVIILFLSSYLEGLLNLKCTQLFFYYHQEVNHQDEAHIYVKWQPEMSDDEKNI